MAGDKLNIKAKDIIIARLNAHLGIDLNSTPVEEKKHSIRGDKSPMVGRNKKSFELSKSLNSKNKLNSSIPMSESKSKVKYYNFIERLGRNRIDDSKSQIGLVQSSGFSRENPEGMTTPRRRKDSSVNRKLERISSASRKNKDLEANLEKEINKIKNKAKDGEIVQEILLIEEDLFIELDENLDSIGKNIKQLKYADLSGKVDALVIINECITVKINEAKGSLKRNSNFLIDSLCKVLYDVFDKSSDKIPLKFGKYFISILNKV